jgi:hypothetical protein
MTDFPNHNNRHRSFQQLAEEAVAVQNASNLTGVLHSFARAMADLRALCEIAGEDYTRHPICRVWVDKVCSLTGYPQDYAGATGLAHRVVSDIALEFAPTTGVQ